MDTTKNKQSFLHLAHTVRRHKDITERRYTQDTQRDASFLYFSTKIADVPVKRIFRPHVDIAMKEIGYKLFIRDRISRQQMLHNAIFDRSKSYLLLVKNNDSNLMEQVNDILMKDTHALFNNRHGIPNFLTEHCLLP